MIFKLSNNLVTIYLQFLKFFSCNKFTGTYEITASAKGYYPLTKTVLVNADKPTQLNFTLARETADAFHSNNNKAGTNNYEKNDSETLERLVSQINLLTDIEKRDNFLIKATDPSPATFVHHDHIGLVDLMMKVKEKCPSITSVYSIGQSVNGSTLYAMIFSDNP